MAKDPDPSEAIETIEEQGGGKILRFEDGRLLLQNATGSGACWLNPREAREYFAARG
jgi:hypothetical protein